MEWKERFYRSDWKLRDGPLLDGLVKATTHRRLQKGEQVIQIGDPQSHVYFLLDGILRGYFIGADGQEVTDCIRFRRGDALTSCLPFEQPSPLSIQALVESEVLVLPTAALIELFQFPELVGIYNQYLQKALENHWRVKVALYQYTARERYLWFLREYPGVLGKINHKCIASFLGITPVTLSRLRKNLREEAGAGESLLIEKSSG